MASVHSGRTYECATCVAVCPPAENLEPPSHDDATFESLRALQDHVKNTHPLVCQECGAHFARALYLRSHVDTQHGNSTLNERRKFACPEPGCERSFTARNNLLAHMKSFHQQPKTFICGNVCLNDLSRLSEWDGSNACGRSFTTKGNLATHVRTAHLGLAETRSQWKSTTTDNGSTAGDNNRDLLRLTGSGYEQDCNVVCPFEDCFSRYCRISDIHIHLEIDHGLEKRQAQRFRGNGDTA